MDSATPLRSAQNDKGGSRMALRLSGLRLLGFAIRSTQPTALLRAFAPSR